MNSQKYEHQSDVAMFIDWENMHGFIRGKANISALKEVAEGYGRLVLAKAYADWREQRFQRDSQVLYQIGIEPIYVPTGFKNNADVKLSTDCIDLAYRNPSIDTYILVTGDGDFVHVANTLRPMGKRVVAIAQSNNASSRLGDLVDTLLIYDIDVDPPKEEAVAPVEPTPTPTTPPEDIREVFHQIVQFIEQESNHLILLTQAKLKLIALYGEFDQKNYGFNKFKALMELGESQGFFSLHTAGLRDWVTLPQENHKIVEMPDELDEIFKEIVAIIKASDREETLLTYIKFNLLRRYGGFDESVYGYSQFKQLMQEGADLGYFRVVMAKNQSDFAAYLE